MAQTAGGYAPLASAPPRGAADGAPPSPSPSPSASPGGRASRVVPFDAITEGEAADADGKPAPRGGETRLVFGLPATKDMALLLAARCLRMYSFGGLSVAIMLYLEAIGLDPDAVAFLLGAIMVGDLLMSLPLTTRADGWGRRRTLVLGAALKMASGAAFALTSDFAVLLVVGVLGVMSPSGAEVGPFRPVEQAALTSLVERKDAVAFSAAFARFNLVGNLAKAAGAGITGAWMEAVAAAGGEGGAATPQSRLLSYRLCMWQYSVLSALMVLAYALLSPAIEPQDERGGGGAAERSAATQRLLGEEDSTRPRLDATTRQDAELGRGDGARADADAVVAAAATASKRPPEGGEEESALQTAPPAPSPTTRRLLFLTGLRHPESLRFMAKFAGLVTFDAFASGIVIQGLLVVWFHRRFGMNPDTLGLMLAVANVCAAVSALTVGPLVARFGAIQAMIVTQIPASALIMAVPLAPNAELAVAVLMLRFCLSQLDIPARQAFVAATVRPDERSASGGLMNLARTVGITVSPFAWTALTKTDDVRSWQFASPFFVSGVVTLAYYAVVWLVFGRR